MNTSSKAPSENLYAAIPPRMEFIPWPSENDSIRTSPTMEGTLAEP